MYLLWCRRFRRLHYNRTLAYKFCIRRRASRQWREGSTRCLYGRCGLWDDGFRSGSNKRLLWPADMQHFADGQAAGPFACADLDALGRARVNGRNLPDANHALSSVIVHIAGTQVGGFYFYNWLLFPHNAARGVNILKIHPVRAAKPQLLQASFRWSLSVSGRDQLCLTRKVNGTVWRRAYLEPLSGRAPYLRHDSLLWRSGRDERRHHG